MQELIRLRCEAGIAHLTLNRPVELNSLSEAAFGQFSEALRQVQAMPEIRVVILQGEGKAFCAGGDIEFFREVIGLPKAARPAEVRRYIGLAHEVVLQLANLKVPLLVAVDGAAAGFGLSLCCLADQLLVSDRSRFVPAYIGLGATPDGGLSLNLSRLLGERRATELLLANRSFTASEAEQWGLATRVVAAGQLDALVAESAGAIVQAPEFAICQTLRLLKQERLKGLKERLEDELETFATCATTESLSEGVNAFLERRAPVFS